MEPQILEFHRWRQGRPDDENEFVVLFHFSLMPRSRREAGQRPEHSDCFWTEVSLQRLLAEKPGWKELSKDDRIKVMFRHAQESIQEARRKLRQAPIFWTATSKHRDGPAHDPKTIEFPATALLDVEPEDPASALRYSARKGAGL
ncbi:MAG: hypothetical protein O7J95_02470 [Planctomycetota bacterium]|nr:hypothetical protein [Planctomycetota bacterium]